MQKARLSKKANRRAMINEDLDYQTVEPIKQPVENSALIGKTENQKRYLKAINSAELIFATGPAGVGKTFLATAAAAKALVEKRIEHIIITRPAVEAGESLGFLPGEIEEKFDPYLAPFKDVLNRRLGRSHVENLIKNEKIEAIPLAYIRGRTFRNSMIILDEAQNTTPMQMKMFLTRIGENCTVIVNGDPKQKDIPGPSGLLDAVERLRDLARVVIVEFDKSDVVRSGLVQQIVERYEG